jgi:uncharacterized damage-inducible protein DinB
VDESKHPPFLDGDQMTMLQELLIAELTREADATRRVLERVPTDKLSWRPHPKSMSLGQLALHIAGLPRGIAWLLNEPVREAPTVPLPEPRSIDELLSALDESIDVAKRTLAEWGEDGLEAEWRMTVNGETVLVLPRHEVARSLMFNHVYHHRGQLTVFLRLLDVPVPGVYGPSADDTRVG